jgi:glycosyltransferase involved in cell wall biosynthesis
MMKIAHSAVVTPHLAGLYETTRDLVVALRTTGCDSRIVDPVIEKQGEERDVPLAGWEFVEEADLVVSHSGLGMAFARTEKPIIHILHGRPYSTFLLEQSGKIAVLTYLRRVRNDPRFRAFVTFWPDFLDYWAMFLPAEKLRAVTAPVDLERWTPEGPDGYGFHGLAGSENVVCADIWRDDKDPFHVIMAFRLLAAARPGIKLHLYASPEQGAAWALVRELLGDTLGEVCGFVEGLDNVYRAADVVITPHRMATRCVREALACGCSVVMAPGNSYTEFTADPENLRAYAVEVGRAVVQGKREKNRESATKHFNPSRTAAEFLEIVEQVI